MMTPSPDNGTEPADLAEVQASDAVLDRLGARAATSHDLLDPAVSALASLAADVDTVPVAGAAEPDTLSRLLELLDD